MPPTRLPELIYVVEDEMAIARIIGDTLEKFGYRHEVFRTAEALFHGLRHRAPDLVILDLGLPDMDGMTVLQQMRGKHSCGLLVVTGRSDTHDRVMGLELGADDYVVKPFNMRELFARAKNLLRRTLALRKLRQDEPVIQFAGWTLNVPRRTLLSPSNEDVRLTQFEFELLLTLARNPGCVLSRDSLIDRVGGRDRAPNDRTIDVLVGRIRRKIEANPKDPRIVITVQGVGYVLAA